MSRPKKYSEFTPRRIPHVLLAALDAGLTAAFGAGLYAFSQGLLAQPMERDLLALLSGVAAVFAVFFWLSAMALSRQVDLLFRPPCLLLLPAGLFARCHRPSWRALWLPRFPRTERSIPWADFHGCRIQEVFLNEFVPIKASLLIESDQAPLEITWAMFQPGIERLQQEILDYHQLIVMQPNRDAARVPEFLAGLFRQPILFTSARIGRMEVAGTVLAAPFVLIGVKLHLAQAGVANAWAIAGLAVCLAITAGILMLRRWISETRFIQLRSNGIAVGPEARRARLIVWHELAFARVHAIAGSPLSSLTKLELRLHNGEAIFIRALPEAARLAALIDPPAEIVQTARRLMAQGHDAPSAARAAGLPLG